MIRIGMSGWTYAPWRGTFYPKGVTQKKELEYASRQVNSIEINGTFYSLQRPASFTSWYEQTPKDFLFAVKAPQYMTHIRRLKEVEEPLSNFLASGLFCLKEKLGPILWQFPPSMTLKDNRFEKFANLLPRTTKAAGSLAQGRTKKRMKGRESLDIKGVGPLRHAFEFRHPSFFNADFFQMLKSHGIAVVFAHGGDEKLLHDEPTADFIYARMHGEGKDFKKGYPKKVLSSWAEQVKKWSKTLDSYIYFNTEEKLHSPTDAMNFAKLMK